jgi:hypothetical protein
MTPASSARCRQKEPFSRGTRACGSSLGIARGESRIKEFFFLVDRGERSKIYKLSHTRALHELREKGDPREAPSEAPSEHCILYYE